MKYIMFEVKTGDLTRLVPVIFPNDLVHSMMADAISSYFDRNGDQIVDGDVVSAGEVSVGVGPCHGRSSTLNIGPRDGDDLVINTMDYFHGIQL